MRKAEGRFWDRVRPRLVRAGIFAERVENLVGDGTPDLHVVAGRAAWIELKAVEGWPARSATPVMGSRSEVRKSQRAWHARYGAHGGLSFLMLGVGARETFLIHGAHAAHCERWCAEELRNMAEADGWEAIIRRLKEPR